MAFRFSNSSNRRLNEVHPDLQRLMRHALRTSPVDFAIVEGVRSMERQKALHAAGATRTLNSRHLTGHAVDIAPVVDGSIRWDWPLFRTLGKHIKATARERGIEVVWGGDWRSFKDGPHFELSRTQYA